LPRNAAGQASFFTVADEKENSRKAAKAQRIDLDSPFKKKLIAQSRKAGKTQRIDFDS
jgi:hypothetical protein